MKLLGLHHVAVICSDYQRSKQFYTEILGLEVVSEVYREARGSYKIDLRLRGNGSVSTGLQRSADRSC